LTAFVEELKNLSYDLNEIGARWALIGALAASIYCDPRTTKDIDIAVVTATTAELENLVSKLGSRGYGSPQSLMHMSPTFQLGVRLTIPSKRSYVIPVDLLSKSSGIESEVVSAARQVEILPATTLSVASLGHMIAMKVLSHNERDRIRDKSDLISLLKVATPTDIEMARSAIVLIENRGFNRGRDLNALFDTFLC
jgi:hypothetical protein